MKHQVSKSKLRKGGPLLWFVCMSGLRCMDVYRALRKTPQLVCGKFFAKHLKLEDQISFLQNTPVHIAIGTPMRLFQLFPHMATDNLHAVVLDISYVDRTQRSLLTASDSRDAFFTLYFAHLHHLCSGKEIPPKLSLENLPSDISKKEKKRTLKKLDKEREKMIKKADTKMCIF
ncbi:hypothetical protein HMI54_012653 [Coelomomyces lativittatus]|nr:hypothetical protein HMI56_005206 [Coelomomyces lativittatus]KAJ1498458.1 hypothetical protein HMI54_012653 [Coelomomyces lativittatus]KAJ1498578.1 hypothetical protein HMI55_004856 [Coelomomyces lativittatus]